MVCLKCSFPNGIDISTVSSKGGLSLGWKGNDLVSIRSYSLYHVDADIHDPENRETWRLTGISSNLDDCSRRGSWDLIRLLGHDVSVPWLVFGDFNEITSSFEKKRDGSLGKGRDFCLLIIGKDWTGLLQLCNR
ncbi:hypothetical protein CXB51_003788 [Gossypium anomalum]|uniref:Endonuclease/exonuclease/phosphatase domain-containing protein n=1 Tax=Gossypium anomalum TaxID=47600 RepID=A0A8J5Z7J9_9ROSI|nr:hypothetical protein CXB51_003788 [Gossypium anomalum]